MPLSSWPRRQGGYREDMGLVATWRNPDEGQWEEKAREILFWIGRWPGSSLKMDEFAAFNTVDINADILAGNIKDMRLSSDERGVREAEEEVRWYPTSLWPKKGFEERRTNEAATSFSVFWVLTNILARLLVWLLVWNQSSNHLQNDQQRDQKGAEWS